MVGYDPTERERLELSSTGLEPKEYSEENETDRVRPPETIELLPAHNRPPRPVGDTKCLLSL